jgi:membrane-associated phospholipid phosphatase
VDLTRGPLLLYGSILYLSVVFGVMLWRGVSIEPEWVVLALLVIAMAMGRGVQFAKDWTPFLLLFFAYEAMRGFASKTGFAPHDVSPLERWLFFGQTPTLVLQQHFYNPHVVSPQDVIAIFFYFMHFPLPIVVGFIFWTTDRDHYWRYVGALLGMSFAAFIVYLFFPTTPPRLELKGAGVHWVTDDTVHKLFSDYVVSPIYQHLNPNDYAAFPSLHAAFPTLAAIFAWQRYRRLALILLGWAACVWLAIVYLGEHYFVDALAGLAFAFVAWFVVNRIRPPRPF